MNKTDYKVDISREFPVAISTLYNAWTQPEQLKKWWKPMDKSLTSVKNDLEKGGKISYVFEDKNLLIEGEYLEVKENEKLVYTWNWNLHADEIKDSHYQLTVDFSGENDKSIIHVVQENFENEEGSLPHKEGWEKGLDDLEDFLKAGMS